MGKRIVLSPNLRRTLQRMGEQIKLARLRRNIPVSVIADRSGLGRTTIWAYAKALHAIEGMDKDLLLICKDDKKGRLLQDLGLKIRARAAKKEKPHHEG